MCSAPVQRTLLFDDTFTASTETCHRATPTPTDMPLVPLEVTPAQAPLPDDVAAFLKEADARHDVFVARRLDKPVPGFHPSDFPAIYHFLKHIQQTQLGTGNRFVEWGSGFGVIASMAAMLGFESYGIEIDEALHQESEDLAEAYEVPVEFALGTFIPEDFELLPYDTDSPNWLIDWGTSGYGELDLEPDDFDVVYAYPWPGEAFQIEVLFEEIAAVGAILITYHGCDETRVRRKTNG